MDRNNTMQVVIVIMDAVALRKESVDRNYYSDFSGFSDGDVALRKESVDRNMLSLSSRLVAGVALRKESVDRNSWPSLKATAQAASLSARRAWIEIALARGYVRVGHGRSPQGERG